MIELITGLPGSGKTLFTLVTVKQRAEKENRPVFYAGITGLTLPWTAIDGSAWMDCPAGSIILIDEAQQLFRPRANGTRVPPYVEALETHRHKGFDIYLITQHPLLIESNVRRLCGRHFHAMRSMGFQKSTLHEWPSVKENCDKSRADSSRHDFKFPKAAYGWYKSAEVHTHKVRVPAKVLLLVALIVGIPALGYRFYSRWQDRIEVSQVEAAKSSASGATVGSGAPAATPASAGGRVAVLGAAEYVQQFQPRVPGLAYTAPAYDEVTKPVRAPYPAACVQSKARCQCYTQQGTKLEVDRPLCEGIAQGGFFMAWDENRGQQMPVVARPVVAPAAAAEPLSGLINATPGYSRSVDRPIADQVADGQNLRHGKNNRIPG